MKHYLLSNDCWKRFSGMILILGIMTLNAFGQDAQTVKGQITDEGGEPLPGVTVLVKGTTTGTVTDVDGNYVVNASNDATLLFSFIGFISVEIPILGRSVIDSKMSLDLKQLDEVVVVGYGTQKKSHLTGAVSKVKNEALDQIPLSRVDDALVGQISGVNVQATNNEAGAAPTIKVRGQGSISSESYPLVVVDGIPVGNDGSFLASLDMNDVASIEVLKDAASSAIYGSRGASGVLMITTKKGKEGPTKFSYNGYYGIKSVPHTDILTTPTAWINKVSQEGVELSDKLKYVQQLGTYTDWEKVMMDGGAIQSHSLSASGGTKNTQFRASLSYLNDEGVLLTDNYKKMNFRMSVDTKVSDRVSFGVTLNPSFTEQRRFALGLHDAIRQNPWLPIYIDENNIKYVNRERENGRWANVKIGDYAMERMFDNYDLVNGTPVASGGTSISATSNQGAYAKVVEKDQRKYETKILANSYVKVNIIDGLDFKQTIGGDYRLAKNTSWTGIQATRNGAGDAQSSIGTNERTHYMSESILSYSKELGKHDISAIGGYTYEEWNTETVFLNSTGFKFDNIKTIPQSLVGAGMGSMEQYQEVLLSYFSRLNYAFDSKYLFSLSIRRDGSSKFGPDKKFGTFWATSAGWNIARESFFPQTNLISDLKLRVSYGISGNNAPVGPYDHIGQVSPVGAVLGGATATGYNQGNISNADLGWEQLQEFNPGFDASLFNGRVNISGDFYRRESVDLLLQQPVPAVTGFNEATVNIGKVRNEGFELEITTRNYAGKNLTWNSSFLVTKNKNTLLSFPGSEDLISYVDDKRPAEWIAKIGQPVSSFYGYVIEKEIPAEFINDPTWPINGQSQDIYVKDLNGDGLIDGDDRTILGNPYPKIIASMNNNINYRGFDLSFMFQGSFGAKVRNIDSQYINNEFASSQDTKSTFTDGNLVRERIYTNDDIQSASYVALRNLNLGYTLPTSLLDKVGVSKVRIYVGAQNLLYIMAKDYHGYNPEGITDGTTTTYGYQRGANPIYRTISTGLNFDF
jgi:TonB-dependent starch-binding outer membrane protein SusC